MVKSGGTIYAIAAQGTTWVKIGSTLGTVQNRLKTLQTGQPFPLQVLAEVSVEGNARRIENQVHVLLAEKPQRGEWFDTPMDQTSLEALVARAVDAVAKLARAVDAVTEPLEQDDEAAAGPTMEAHEFAAWMKRHGLSDQRTATLFGVARGTIWRYRQPDSGDQRPIHPTVARMCHVIDLAPKMFIPELERMAKEESR